jgi:hypothetical protein
MNGEYPDRLSIGLIPQDNCEYCGTPLMNTLDGGDISICLGCSTVTKKETVIIRRN